VQGVERLCLVAYDSDKPEASRLRPDDHKISAIWAVLGGLKPPNAATAALGPPVNRSEEGLDRLREQLNPVLADAVHHLDFAVEKSKRRFVRLGPAITYWRDRHEEVGRALCRLGLPEAASRLDRMSYDLLGDICAVLAVTVRQQRPRSTFESIRRTHKRPRIPGGDLHAIRKARGAARSNARKLRYELELVRRQLSSPGETPGGEQGDEGAGKGPAKRPGRTPKAHRRKRQPQRVANAEMMEVHTAVKAGLSRRAIAQERKKLGKLGTSPTTISEWYEIADAVVNPKSRSKRVRHRLREDHRGQTDLSEDRRRDSNAVGDE